MDNGLFKKYSVQIDTQKKSKKEISEYIQEVTNIYIEEKDITISKKIISLNLSSVQKSKLTQKNIQKLLSEKGYTLKN
jgi:hypothetical protein